MYFGFLGNQTPRELQNSFLDKLCLFKTLPNLKFILKKENNKENQTTPTNPQEKKKPHTSNCIPQRQATELILCYAPVPISPHCKPIQ